MVSIRETERKYGKMLRIEEILPLLCGEFICALDGVQIVYQCKEDLEKTGLYKNYIVTSVSVQEGKIALTLTPWQIPTADSDSVWVKESTKKNGVEPSFF